MTRLVFFVALAVGLVIAPVTAYAAEITTVTSFNAAEGELPEGLAIDQQGNLFAGMAPTGTIVRVTPTGVATTFAQLPSPQPNGFLTGLEFGWDGDLFAALSSFNPETHGIWRISQGGTVVERFAAPTVSTFLNDLVFRGDALFVSDSTGSVLQVDRQGDVRLWAESPLLEGDPALTPAIGANGLALRGQDLFVANTSFGRIVRIPILANGRAGLPEVFVENIDLLGGADGIEFDDQGRLHVAVNRQNQLALIEPDGDITVTAQGDPLQFPASVEIRAGRLFLTNFALLHATGALPGTPMPALLRTMLMAPVAPVQAPSAVPPTPADVEAPRAPVQVPGVSAVAQLRTVTGEVVGTATLTQVDEGVQVTGTFRGLTPGEHGFHIHAVGQCEPPAFTSAGGHFNPTGREHGLLNPQGHHLGDLPNLVVNASGVGTINTLAEGVTLTAGPTSLFDADGSALVIHADPDDLRTDPAGNAGPRVACGVVVAGARAPVQIPTADR